MKPRDIESLGEYYWGSVDEGEGDAEDGGGWRRIWRS